MSDLKHEILQDIKRVASELGKTPTRTEYCDQKLGKYPRSFIDHAFGSWSVALQAAGLETHKKSVKDFFLRDVGTALETYHETILAPLKPTEHDFKTTIGLGDLHEPFSNPTTKKRCIEFVGDVKPKRAVQIGDLFDMFAHARFPRSHNVYTPLDEMQKGFEKATQFWKDIQEASPGIECYQLLGNHDARPMKKLMASYPEGEIFFSVEKYFTFENVKTIMDPRQELILGDIVFQHGHLSQLGMHRDHNLMNTVDGHSHVGGVSFRQMAHGKILWELNCGYMGDANSKPLSYTPGKIVKWTQGWGYIDEWGPRFIHV